MTWATKSLCLGSKVYTKASEFLELERNKPPMALSQLVGDKTSDLTGLEGFHGAIFEMIG